MYCFTGLAYFLERHTKTLSELYEIKLSLGKEGISASPPFLFCVGFLCYFSIGLLSVWVGWWVIDLAHTSQSQSVIEVRRSGHRGGNFRATLLTGLLSYATLDDLPRSGITHSGWAFPH